MAQSARTVTVPPRSERVAVLEAVFGSVRKTSRALVSSSLARRSGRAFAGGGGGGGRIALWYDGLPFTGSIAAYGGNGYGVAGQPLLLAGDYQPTGQLQWIMPANLGPIRR